MYLHTPVLEVGSWWRVDTASGTNTPATVYAHDGADAIPTALGASGSTVRGNTRDGTGLFWSTAATLYCKELTYQGVPTGTVVTSAGVTPTTPSGAPVDIATISAAVAALPTTYVQLLVTDATSTTLTGTLTAGHLSPVDCTAGAGARTLPAAASVAAGTPAVAKKADTTANALVVSRAGSDLIFGTGAGATSKTLTLSGEAVTFVSNGVDRWSIESSDTPVSQLDLRYPPIAATPVASAATSGTLTAAAEHNLTPTSAAAWTLPTSVSATRLPTTVKNNGTAAVTVARGGSDTINGGTASVSIAAGEWARFTSDGAGAWTQSGTAGESGTYASQTQALPLAWQNSRALGSRYNIERPPVNTTPTITLSSSQPGVTTISFNGSTGGAGGNTFTSVNTSTFSFIGGKYVKGNTSSPGNFSARMRPLPNSTTGFGPVISEFFSDSPNLAVSEVLAEGGTLRIVVDGAEVYRCGPAVRTGTAQAGASGSVTLDSGASATNGLYTTRWVRLTGGTGSGQVRLITGYTGSTKVATVAPNWTTAPDNTSTFAVELYRQDNNTGGSNSWVLVDWSGERRFRHYRLEYDGLNQYQVTTGANDTVMPGDPRLGTTAIWVGDSFSAGTGGSGSYTGSLAAVACGLLGWNLVNVSIGGTGYLNPLPLTSASILNAYDRILPPTNSWWVFTNGASAGTFTLTQGGVTTGTIAFNASLANVKTAVDAAFGANVFDTVGAGAGCFWLIGRSAPTSAATMTADFSGLTSGAKVIQRWTGDVAPNVPTDASGNALPFNLVLANGHNDTTGTSAGYTGPVLQAQVTSLLAGIKTTFPTATVYVIGNMYLPGGSIPAEVTVANTAINAACTASLPKIGGVLPFIDTVTTSWFTGTGFLGAQTGTGNSDINCTTDGIHPTPWGHVAYGRRIAQAITQILGRQVNP